MRLKLLLAATAAICLPAAAWAQSDSQVINTVFGCVNIRTGQTVPCATQSATDSLMGDLSARVLAGSGVTALQATVGQQGGQISTNATNILAETNRAQAREAQLAPLGGSVSFASVVGDGSGLSVAANMTAQQLVAQVAAQQTAGQAEVSRAQTAEQANTTAIGSEASRAKAAEALAAPATALTAEASTARSAEQTNASSISTETGRAQGVEATKAASTDLTAESSRAKAAEALAAPATALASETSTARAAEQSNATSITSEASTARSAEAANSSATAAAAATANAAAPMPSLTNEVTRAKAAEALALPVAGGTMTGALTTPSVSLGGGVLTAGVSFSVTGKQRAWDGNGASAANSDFYSARYVYGPANGGVQLYVGGGESIMDPSQGGFSEITGVDALSAGSTGNRQVVYGSLVQQQMPAQQGTYEGVVDSSRVAVPGPMPAGWGFPVSLANVTGGVETGWDYNRVSAQGQQANFGRETDVTYDPAIGVFENIGDVIGSQSSQPDTAFGTNRPGLAVNIAVDTFGGDFDAMYAINKPTGSWTADANTVGLMAYVRAYGGPPVANPMMRAMVDGRAINYALGSLEFPGFGVSPTGAASGNGLVTTGTVTAQTASVSGGTIVHPGFYVAWPSLTVAAPTAGGTTANVAVTAMVPQSIVAFGSTGKGYAAGDVLTGTGIAYTVGTVDSNGAILTGTFAGTQAASVPSSTPIQTLTGGKGSGATMLVEWTRDSTNAFFVPTAVVFAATGAAFAVGDTITLAGDTGTAGVFTVPAVSPTGGIMMGASAANGIHVSGPAQAVTAIASGTYHTVTTSGSGIGASVQVAYGVSSVSATNGGTGYQVQPPPLIVPSQSIYGNAEILAQMTPVAAVLALNGGETIGQGVQGPVALSGGNIYNNLTAPIPLTCAIGAPAGGVAPACHATMATTLNVNSLGSGGSNYTAGVTYTVIDAYNDVVGAMIPANVDANGKITAIQGTGGTSTPFPLVNGSIPVGPFTIKGGNNDATLQYANFAPSQAAIDDPGNGFATAPTATVSAASNQIAAATGTASLVAMDRVSSSVVVLGSFQAAGGVVSPQTASNTASQGMCGTKIRDTATGAHNFTVPTGLRLGCQIEIIQVGGQITFVAGSGETLEQAGTGTLAHATTGSFAKATILVDSASTFLVGGQVQ